MRGADPAAAARPGTRPGAPGARIVVDVEPELAELVDDYLAHRRTEARALLGVLDAGDYADLWRRGHHLKGAGAAYGFAFLSEVGAALEAAARRRDASAVRRAAAALRDYLARLDVRLQQP
jgi:HPt (histidine-containing phosphotransfer) domain-containing protein